MIVTAIVNAVLAAGGLLGRLIKAIAPALPWLAVAVVGAVVWNWTPAIGPAARIARIEADRDQWVFAAGEWKKAAVGWEASFRRSESRRREETATAQAAATSLIRQCGERVEEARRSARVIERIVTQEPTYDEVRCPVRSLVDPGLVRDALQPGAD